MNRSTRVATLLLNWGFAQTVFVLGLALWFSGATFIPGQFSGLALVAAGGFLAMWLVIDPLVPDAGKAFAWSLKAGMLLLFYVYAGLSFAYAGSAVVG